MQKLDINKNLYRDAKNYIIYKILYRKYIKRFYKNLNSFYFFIYK